MPYLQLTGDASNAVQLITSGITALRPIEVTHSGALVVIALGVAHIDLDQLDDAWRCIGEAMKTIEATKERWC